MKDQPISSSPDLLPTKIGPYKIIKKIASGGMGEVFWAQDPFCKRSIALKKIRSDRLSQPGFKERFLKEVKIAAQLSHPSIIPIYQIHQTSEEIYYTMPLVRGKTLKEIIKTTLEQEKEGRSLDPIGSSIPALMRIFVTICQAIAYSHSKGILHRDLKPDNIIIGPYGEVLILDWGLADFVDSNEEDLLPSDPIREDELSHLTRPGKIAGTLSYLAPERVFGKKASYASDIYALGVILYQLLTLRVPFRRKNVKTYKQQIKHERLQNPSECAPHRDIPPQLSRIARKCLERRPEKRYSSVEAILIDLNNYIEGHAEWVPQASLLVANEEDWKFQENVLLAKHIALTQKSDPLEWVNLMLAKDPYPGRIKLETHVHIKEGGRGIGFYLNLRPQEEGKDMLREGLLLWIGSEESPGCYLFRSNVELISNPNLFLKPSLPYFLRIEKTDHHIKVWLNDLLALDYLSYIPFHGPYFGLVLRDDNLDVGTILVSSSSSNIQVSCLAVPDTLLALRHFKEAQTAYRQIAHSFPGRTEGKEALFRAGIALLEEAQYRKKGKRELLLEEALLEFDKCQGSPLEYLGKSLVYKATQELEEEVKCLELSLRRFSKHPLISLVKEEVAFRLHESSYKDRRATYEFALLILKTIPQLFARQDHRGLLSYLEKNCEDPDFLSKEDPFLTIRLAFWLAKPLTLLTLAKQSPEHEERLNALYALLYLGYHEALLPLLTDPEFEPVVDFYALGWKETAHRYFSSPSFSRKRAFDYLLSRFYFVNKATKRAMVKTLEQLCLQVPSLEERLGWERRLIEFLFYLGDSEKAKARLSKVPSPLRELDSSPFYFLQGCLLAQEKGMKVSSAHLSRIADKPHPPSAYLIDSYLASHDKKTNWLSRAFLPERTLVFRQLALLYLLTGQTDKAKQLERQLKKEEASLKKTLNLPSTS